MGSGDGVAQGGLTWDYLDMKATLYTLGLCVGSCPKAENPAFLLRGGLLRASASLPYGGNVFIHPHPSLRAFCYITM